MIILVADNNSPSYQLGLRSYAADPTGELLDAAAILGLSAEEPTVWGCSGIETQQVTVATETEALQIISAAKHWASHSADRFVHYGDFWPVPIADAARASDAEIAELSRAEALEEADCD